MEEKTFIAKLQGKNLIHGFRSASLQISDTTSKIIIDGTETTLAKNNVRKIHIQSLDAVGVSLVIRIAFRDGMDLLVSLGHPPENPVNRDAAYGTTAAVPVVGLAVAIKQAQAQDLDLEKKYHDILVKLRKQLGRKVNTAGGTADYILKVIVREFFILVGVYFAMLLLVNLNVIPDSNELLVAVVGLVGLRWVIMLLISEFRKNRYYAVFNKPPNTPDD